MKKIAGVILTVMMVVNVAFASNFSDVKSGSWAEKTISNLVKQGIVDGYPDGTFKPDDTIARSEFSKLIQEQMNIKELENEEVVFEDIVGTWAEKRIKALEKKGIIKKEEYKEGYKPNEAMTRVEMAKMIVRGLEVEIKEVEKTTFKDDEKIKKEDKKYIETAKETGIISGYPDGKFKPYETATRAETAVMIERMMTYQKAKNDGVEIVSGIKFDKKNDIIKSDLGKYDGAMKLDKQQEFVMKYFDTLKFTKEKDGYYVSGCLPKLPEGYKWGMGIKVFYDGDKLDSWHSDSKARKDTYLETGKVFKRKLKYSKNKIDTLKVSIEVYKDSNRAKDGRFILIYENKTLKKITTLSSETKFINDSINWGEMFKW